MNWISKTRRPNMASRHSTTPAKKATVGPIYRQHRRDYRRTVDEPSKPVTSCTIFPYHKRFILSKHQKKRSKTFPHTSASEEYLAQHVYFYGRRLYTGDANFFMVSNKRCLDLAAHSDFTITRWRSVTESHDVLSANICIYVAFDVFNCRYFNLRHIEAPTQPHFVV